MIEFRKTGLLTNLSVKRIEDMIIGSPMEISKSLFVPNVYWGFFDGHEADLVKISRTGYLTEYEIKRSWSDFVADFKKSAYHTDNRISEFYYVVPDVMWNQAVEYIKSFKSMIFSSAGVYSFTDEGVLSLRKTCNYPKGNKMYIEDMYEIARLGVLRYWSNRFKEDCDQSYSEPFWLSCNTNMPAESRLNLNGEIRKESMNVLTIDENGRHSVDKTINGKWESGKTNIVAWMKIPDVDCRIEEDEDR